MYLITEIADRECHGFHAAPDGASAATKANELLETHCKLGGHQDAFTSARDGLEPDKWPDDVKLAGDGDDRDPSGAWCNLGCGAVEAWDAHVHSVDKNTRRSMLDMLLKELCRDAMKAPGSNCGDGSCEDCCITSCLELLAETWPETEG